jgi:hypothetical protein
VKPLLVVWHQLRTESLTKETMAQLAKTLSAPGQGAEVSVEHMAELWQFVESCVQGFGRKMHQPGTKLCIEAPAVLVVFAVIKLIYRQPVPGVGPTFDIANEFR